MIARSLAASPVLLPVSSFRWASLALLLPAAAAAQRVGVELGARSLTNADETLSPMRYHGTAPALRAEVAVHRFGLDIALDGDLTTPTLTSDVASSAGRPETRVVATTIHLGVTAPERALGFVALRPGVRVLARIAAREHQFTSEQTGGRFAGSTQPSFDEILALQPTLRLERASGRGHAFGLSLAATAVGVVRHPYFPRDASDDAPWRFGGPGRILVAEGGGFWSARTTRRLALGARYSLQLVRIRGTSAVGEVSHQLGATVSWGAQ